MGRRSIRAAIWTAVGLQGLGLAIDAIWHGLVNPGFEAETVAEMVRHLSTVHLTIYVGAVAVLISTGWALGDRIRRSARSIESLVAFTGALISAAGEAWHAYTHLQLSTHSGPLAAATSFFGLLVVVLATWLGGRRERRHARAGVERQRAA